MLNVTLNNNLLQRGVLFFKKYGLFITPVLLFLFFMFLLVFSYTKSSTQKTTTIAPASSTGSSSSSSQSEENPSQTSYQKTEGIEADEIKMHIWTGRSFDPSDLDGYNATQTTLPDGSIQYSYDSDNPNRPNIIIAKNGVNVFERTPFSNTSIADATDFFGKPEYVEYGSIFWGGNAVTYIYISRGVAFVLDPSTNQTLEEMIFEPGSMDLFKQYDTDMIGQPQKP